MGKPCGEVIKPLEKVLNYRRPRLDLHGDDIRPRFYGQIDLVPFAVAPEVQIVPLPPVIPVFKRLNDHKVFKEIPLKRMTAYVELVLGAQEIRRKAHVVEIEFWGFDLAFGDIGIPRLKKKNHIACFQEGKPVSCGGMGNPHVIAETLEVEQLPHASCTEADELLKQGKVLYGC